ncbi:MAG: formylmethanofuran dehydrogenase subunit E family protein [candidate division WOR-3 bacterium]|nr:MAG: formylmethanofuran dehydrogenase subunit E family protein [candidate division WOR-3 bacterium]
MRQPAPLKHAAGFHGHLGPWLALGLRAGRRAVNVLGRSPFRLKAVVHCPARTPYTCFIDGVQFASGCTLGKGNIRHIRSARVWVEFSRYGTTGSRFTPGKLGGIQASLKLELHPELWTELLLKPARTRPALEDLSLDLYRRPLARLFIETRR